MSDLSPAERRDLFLSLIPLLSAALEQADRVIALRYVEGDDAQAARVEAVETLELLDAEIERRRDLLLGRKRGSN